jgi:hypothetical protein
MPETTETVLDDTTTAAPTTETVVDEVTTAAPETTETVVDEVTTAAPEVVEEPIIPKVTLEDAMNGLETVETTFGGFIESFREKSHAEYLASDASLNSTHSQNLQFNDKRVVDAGVSYQNTLESLAAKRANMTASWEETREQTKDFHEKMRDDQVNFFESELKDWATNSKAEFDNLMSGWNIEEGTTETTGDDAPVVEDTMA